MSHHSTFGEVLAEELNAIDLRRIYAKHGSSAVLEELVQRGRLTWPELEAPQPNESVSQRQAREDRNVAKVDAAMRQAALDRDLVGLSLSGGGIRSATFGLGILQAMASLNLLKRVDYLSTISGGGYIGSWLATWIRREGVEPEPSEGPESLSGSTSKDAVKNVQHQLNPSRIAQAEASRPLNKEFPIVDQEPEAIRHLRSFSNYLAPRPGFLTADTWTLLGIYVRNFLLNQLILLPFTVAFVLMVWLVVISFGPLAFGDGSIRGLVFLILLLWSFLLIGLEMTKLYRARTKFSKDPPRVMKVIGNWRIVKWSFQPMSGLSFHAYVIWPLVVTAVLACWLFGIKTDHSLNWRLLGNVLTSIQSYNQVDGETSIAPSGSIQSLILRVSPVVRDWDSSGKFSGSQAFAFSVGFGLLHFLMHAIGMLLGLVIDCFRLQGRKEWWERFKRDFFVLAASMASGAFGGFLFYLFWIKFLIPFHADPSMLATFGPPLAIALFTAAAFAEVGLLGRNLEEDEREWWARVTAFLLTHALIWMVIFAAVVFLPLVVMDLDRRLHNAIGSGLIAGWIATSLGGAAAGRSEQVGKPGIGKFLELLSRIAPLVFLLGLLAIVSLSIWRFHVGFAHVVDPSQWLTRLIADLNDGRSQIDWRILLDVLGGCIVIGIVMNILLNVNLFSLHAMYANRLVRCYLGASRRKDEWNTTWRSGVWHPGLGGAPTGTGGKVRSGQLITGFDFHDDIALRELRIGPAMNGQADDIGYWGPLRLLGTSMNLLSGEELALQDRRAESFVLTPLYCGSKGTGYRKLDKESDSLLTVGRAMAISGAAIDPSIGAQQSAALTALMTIFNARLGWWMKNPKWPGEWTARSPRFANLLWYELAGHTDENSRYVHLSDGGHFENLGVYELVRRRCRYIIACDAGQDPNSVYDDLATLSRLCRSDFGIRIELDTSPIDPDPKTRHGRWHCAIGQIHYEDVDPGELPGILVYIKASLTGDEPSDVRNYAMSHPDFPHQTTVDQFFNEAQFESYRALGHHIASTVFNSALQDTDSSKKKSAVDAEGLGCSEVEARTLQEFKRENRDLFSKLRARWFPAPPEIETKYGETARAFGRLQGVMRSDPALREFSRDLNPELGSVRSGLKDGDAEHMPTRPKENSRVIRADRRSAELHMINQVIQVMEKAWMGVRMEGYPEHPINRGWMNALRRVSRSKTLRRNWPIVRGGFDQEFVQFCERELGLPNGSPTPFRLLKNSEEKFVISATGSSTKVVDGAIRVLNREFMREWPGIPDLSAMLQKAQTLKLDDNEPAAWILCSTRRDQSTGTDRPTFPIGVILAWSNKGNRASSGSEIEFFSWIRGPYRNMGIGHECLSYASPDRRRLFDKILDGLTPAGTGKTASLIVRYPKTPRGSRIIEKKLWLNFHYTLDFRIKGAVDLESGVELKMQRTLTANDSGSNANSSVTNKLGG